MNVEYLGAREIRGALLILEGVEDVAYDEIATITASDADTPPLTGRVIRIDGDVAVVLVFEGTRALSLTNTVTRFTGRPMTMPLSQEILGRTFNGMGRPMDGMGNISATVRLGINGTPVNPTHRIYPRGYVETGFSAIDGLLTLIRGQKLPIFTGDGLPHDRLAADIAANISTPSTAIVFAAMGVKHDIAEYFRRSLTESGALERSVLFLNLAGDPPTERIITPRCALTAAEYLAFDCGMDVLVILTDMTAYAEALREISSARGEIPSRKGYPGYLYSDLASLYERAGIIKGKCGSLTQIPILTMPGDDITHPVADLTGYITEGQIVLDRALYQRGIYPPINVLPSLSRLMKDGIGEGKTYKDHPDLAKRLFASYAKVSDARAMVSIVGEEDLSEADRKTLAFGRYFENDFIRQRQGESRTLEETLGLGWDLLSSVL
ncbi:MAG: V-type ATP synthase subunit B [Defluviitaleaceae bacterium]|nr:V-type ATP synthase subunit B [Defluviitaleaceae bacterium]